MSASEDLQQLDSDSLIRKLYPINYGTDHSIALKKKDKDLEDNLWQEALEQAKSNIDIEKFNGVSKETVKDMMDHILFTAHQELYCKEVLPFYFYYFFPF